MKRFVNILIILAYTAVLFSCTNTGGNNTENGESKETNIKNVIEKGTKSSGSEDTVTEETVESTCPYALMHGGVMYYATGEYVFEDVEYTEDDILGKVTSTITETKMPSVDGQANIPIEGCVYMKHNAGDGLLALVDGKWHIFETRSDNETIEDGTASADDGEKTDEVNITAADNGREETVVQTVYKEPPALTVGAQGNESISAMRTGYSWIYENEDGGEVGICADGLHPLQAKEYMPQLTVKPSAQSRVSSKTVYLDFEFEPQEISVRAWSTEYYGNPDAESIPIGLNTVEVDFADSGYDSYTEFEIFPEEYIYEVTASWKNKADDGFEGTALYSFSAEYSVPVLIGELEAE